jgi:hypothetical protein
LEGALGENKAIGCKFSEFDIFFRKIYVFFLEGAHKIEKEVIGI